MKKIIIASLCLIFGIQIVKAQNSISGTVVDKKGTPVHGALVEVKGSSEKVTTDFDGSFTIKVPTDSKKLTATYVGLNSKTQKMQDGMNVILTKESWWTKKPRKYHLTVCAQVLLPESGTDCIAPGLMVGYAKCYGGYMKAFYSGVKGDVGVEGFVTGKEQHAYTGFVFGGMARLGGNLYACAGVGPMKCQTSYKTTKGWLDIEDKGKLSGAVADFGFILNLNGITLNAGAMYFMYDKKDNLIIDVSNNFMLNAGIGYSF